MKMRKLTFSRWRKLRRLKLLRLKLIELSPNGPPKLRPSSTRLMPKQNSSITRSSLRPS